MMGWHAMIWGALALLIGAPAAAQTAAASAPAISRAADEAAIIAVLRDVYAIISGPAGQARDAARMRTMFAPNARLTALGAKGLNSYTVEEFIEKAVPYQTRIGFHERELAHRVELYGDIAHAWSSYHGTGQDGANKVDVRGINSFQLVRQNGRWTVQSIFWQAEGPGRPFPADMTGR